MAAAQKGGYAHFMLKEINEQPQAARELLHLLEASSLVAPFLDRISRARQLYLIGCGTSYHACLLGAVYLAQLAGRPAIPILAPQFIPQYSPAVGPDDVGVFVSQSGETKDVLNALHAARQHGMTALGLVNVIGSTLMKESEISLPMACGYEISVPATKTFTNQVLAFLYLALRLGKHSTGGLAQLPELIQDTLAAVEPQVQRHCTGAGAVGRSVLPRLWRDVCHCAGGRAQAERDHLRALRRHALDRVQAWAAVGRARGLPGDFHQRTGGCAAAGQRHQRDGLPRRAHDCDRR